MVLQGVIALAAAAMVGSIFMPWIKQPLTGQAVIPWDFAQPVIDLWQENSELAEDLLRGLPLEAMLFIGSFAAAALIGLLALFRLAPRILVLATALLPLGAAGLLLMRGRDTLAANGLPVPELGDLGDLAGRLAEQAQIGIWAYLGGAGILLLGALVFPSRR